MVIYIVSSFSLLLSTQQWISMGTYVRINKQEFDPWVRQIPWSRRWQPAPVFLPEKFHGKRSLEGYSAWGCRELDMTEHIHTHVERELLVQDANFLYYQILLNCPVTWLYQCILPPTVRFSNFLQTFLCLLSLVFFKIIFLTWWL